MQSARRALDRRSFNHGADDSLRIREKLTRRGRGGRGERSRNDCFHWSAHRDRHWNGHGRLARAKSARTGFRAGGDLARNIEPTTALKDAEPMRELPRIGIRDHAMRATCISFRGTGAD